MPVRFWNKSLVHLEAVHRQQVAGHHGQSGLRARKIAVTLAIKLEIECVVNRYRRIVVPIVQATHLTSGHA